MGYLKANRSENPGASLAFVTKYPEEVQLEKHPIYHNYLLGSRERARELGYNLEYFNMMREGLSGKRLTTVLESRGIEGIIVPPVYTIHDQLDIDFDKFASITFGYSFDAKNINRVSLDHFSAVLHSLEKMASKGHRRIGFVMDGMKERVQFRWKAAYLMFIDLYKDQYKIPPIEQKYTKEAFLNWFFEHKPTAILSQRVDWAEFLYEEGLLCGKDYGFASLSLDSAKVENAKLSCPKLASRFKDAAGLHQNSHYTGRYAVELLAQEIALNLRGFPRVPKVTLINGDWHDGPTLNTIESF
ncbi:hypothetical protein QEH57_06745 [Pelagicoccus sp. SDUM812005]|nr:hypothetical protein [Pelagicoccus sp. SDUM812005]